MSTRYIADLHLYDSYSYKWREYLNMNIDGYASFLIDNWNSVVDVNDMVIIAGDVGHYCPNTRKCLQMLKGTKILVVGNHDAVWQEHLYDAKLFAGTHYNILLNGIYVTHKPEVSNDVRQTVSYIIHGHHHRYDTASMQQELLKYSRDVCRYNCAADLIGHKPRTLQELMLQKELLLDRCREKEIL